MSPTLTPILPARAQSGRAHPPLFDNVPALTLPCRRSMDACRSLLQQFSDPQFEHDVAVRESCEVALDATDYWATATQLQGSGWEAKGFAQQKVASV